MKIAKSLSAVVVVAGVLSGCSTVTPEQLVERTVPDKSVPIYFTAFSPTFPNSVDGVGVHQQFINPGRKVIKYVLTDYTAQDRVLTTVRSRISSREQAGTKATGPFPFGAMTNYDKFDALWYNGSIECVTMQRVTIIYMDDTKSVIDGADVAKVVRKGQLRSCRS